MHRLTLALLSLAGACSGRGRAPTAPAPVAPLRACAGGPTTVLPTFALPPGPRVCDLADRVILIDDTAVTVLARPGMSRTRAPIAKTDHLGNRCGDNGSAGCSITYDRFWSTALGTAYVEFGTNEGNVLLDNAHPNASESCREESEYEVVATCSTPTHFVLVKDDAPDDAAAACWRLHARLWTGPADASVDLDGDVDRAASTGDRWVFRFPPGASAVGPVTLTFDGGTASATLEVGGDREACVAFRLGPT